MDDWVEHGRHDAPEVRFAIFSSSYNSALVLELDEDKPGARVVWKGNSDSEVITDAVHVMMMTPVIIGDYTSTESIRSVSYAAST